MAKEFHFRFKGRAEDLIARVREDCEKNGLSLQGDAYSGRVSGMGLKASYSINDERLCARVEKIPFFLSWGFVENQATSMAGGYGAERIC